MIVHFSGTTGEWGIVSAIAPAVIGPSIVNANGAPTGPALPVIVAEEDR